MRMGNYAFDQALAWTIAEKAVMAIVILIVTWALAKAAKWAFAKLVDAVPLFQRPSGSGQSVGLALGRIISLFIWLFGLLAILQVLELDAVGGPINSLLENVVRFVPNLIGAGLLLWIGVKMLVPEHGSDHEAEGSESSGSGDIWKAIKTIIIADAVMSLDNVIAIAAAANGQFILIAIGLALSVPLIIYGSTLILHFLIRYPLLVMVGAGLVGWIAGEIWISDPAVSGWTEELIETYGHWLEYASAARRASCSAR